MNFLYPAFLAGAVAIAIPIALHFLRRDVAPEVPFTAVRLLQRSPIERSRRRRLRDLWLLAARVAALLLLALAFARPYLAGAAGAGSTLRIVAIDRSFSMGAPARFERARALAGAAIGEAGSGERVTLIAFDDRADVVASGAAGDARAALATLKPGAGATRYAAAIARAVDEADGQPARLVIVTDLQRSGWEDERRAAVPASLQIEVRDAGSTTENLAVTGVRTDGDRLIAALRAYGPARAGTVKVIRDGRDVAAAPFSIGADGAVDVPVAFRAPASGALAVSIEDPLGFAADNTRFVLLDRAARQSLLVVTSSGAPDSAFYLSRALAAASGVGSDFDVRTLSGSALSAMPASELARQSAVVLLSTRGLDRRGREHLAALVRRGGGLLVAAAPEVEPSVLSSVFDWRPPLERVEQDAGALSLAATDLRHPIFQPFGALAANLGQVRFDRAWRVRADGWDVAARFTDGSPALLERAGGSGRIVLFASDVDRRWNDFPLHPAFVPFAVEAVRYVAAARERATEYVVAGVPAGLPPEPGIHRAEPGARMVAVNVDSRESALARVSGEEFAAMVDAIPPGPGRPERRARQTEAVQGYWRYGLLLMIAALVAESVAGRA